VGGSRVVLSTRCVLPCCSPEGEGSSALRTRPLTSNERAGMLHTDPQPHRHFPSYHPHNVLHLPRPPRFGTTTPTALARGRSGCPALGRRLADSYASQHEHNRHDNDEFLAAELCEEREYGRCVGLRIRRRCFGFPFQTIHERQRRPPLVTPFPLLLFRLSSILLLHTAYRRRTRASPRTCRRARLRSCHRRLGVGTTEESGGADERRVGGDARMEAQYLVRGLRGTSLFQLSLPPPYRALTVVGEYSKVPPSNAATPTLSGFSPASPSATRSVSSLRSRPSESRSPAITLQPTTSSSSEGGVGCSVSSVLV